MFPPPAIRFIKKRLSSDDELGLHAGSPVGLAVVVVVSGLVEGHRPGVTFLTELNDEKEVF